MQPGQHVLEGHAPHLLAKAGIDGRKLREAGGDGLQVKPATADNDGIFSPRDNVGHGIEGAAGVLRGIHFAGARDAAEEMMRDAGLIGGAWLRAEHGEFAVKLESVGAHDFAGVAFGESEGDIRFADGGRSGEEDGLAEDGAVGHSGEK